MYWPIATSWTLEPFAELSRLQREVNRLFDGCSRRERYPALNVWSNENEALVEAEIPGMDPKELNLTVQGDTLTVEGERKPLQVDEKATLHRQEREAGRFSRSIRLPFELDNSKVKARYERGILQVTLPRREDTKPKSIAISVG